jgi:crotonobetainyl-CoA:carnitine CoA-transferase CaiB-like acyl-CoA transferase
MGAEVIKIELAPNGDLCRNFPYVKNKRSAYFVQQNRGKLSLCVDTKNPEGNAIVRDLIPLADVLVQNYAPGVIGRMGFDYERVRKLNPKIIMCSVSTFGQTGPLASEPGYDFIGQAYAGVTYLSGEEGGDFYPPALAVGDVSTGVHAYAAVATALLHRERTGEGQHLDISLLDSYIHYHEASFQMYSLSNGKINPQRSGAHSWYATPAGVFKAKDRYVIIIAPLPQHFSGLCEAMGQPELVKDPRFADHADRLKNLKELVAIIEKWFESMPSDEAALARLKEHRVPHAPILSVAEALEHPHLRQRGSVRTVHDRVLGDFQVPGFALRFSEFPERLKLEAPFLGEHNQEVLTKYAGLTPAQVKELEGKGILRRATK